MHPVMRMSKPDNPLAALARLLWVLNMPGCGCVGHDSPCNLFGRTKSAGLRELGAPIPFSTLLTVSSTEGMPDGRGGMTYPVPLDERIIKTQAALDDYWRFPIFANHPKPQVDFKRQTLIAAASHATDRAQLAVTRVSAEQIVLADQYYCDYSSNPPVATTAVLAVVPRVLPDYVCFAFRAMPCRNP